MKEVPHPKSLPLKPLASEWIAADDDGLVSVPDCRREVDILALALKDLGAAWAWLQESICRRIFDAKRIGDPLTSIELTADEETVARVYAASQSVNPLVIAPVTTLFGLPVVVMEKHG